ncbi:hypothetical protein NKH77_35275 [Streptomyces sp. M19]
MSTLNLLPRSGRGGSTTVVVVASRVGSYVVLVRGATYGEGREAAPGSGPHADHIRDAPDADHIRVDLDGAADETWRSCADVLYGVGTPERAERTLRGHPARCWPRSATPPAAASRSPRRRPRQGRRAGRPRALSRREHEVIASLLHTWLVAALPLGALISAICVRGGRRYAFIAEP